MLRAFGVLRSAFGWSVLVGVELDDTVLCRQALSMVRASFLFAPRSPRHYSRWGVGGTLTLESLGFPSRTQTVYSDQRLIKAVRRMRTTLREHVTLGVAGVPMLVMSPSALWDPLYGMLNMLCQGGDASRVQLSLSPLSRRNTLSIVTTITPCTLGRWDAQRACEGGGPAAGGCEISIPQPLKYILAAVSLVVLFVNVARTSNTRPSAYENNGTCAASDAAGMTVCCDTLMNGSEQVLRAIQSTKALFFLLSCSSSDGPDQVTRTVITTFAVSLSVCCLQTLRLNADFCEVML